MKTRSVYHLDAQDPLSFMVAYKKSGPAPEAPKPIETTTNVGNLLDPVQQVFDEGKEDKKADMVKTAKQGTSGMQIKDKTTPLTATAATTGIQI